MISYWQASERAIPPEIASEIRKLGDIGPVGTIIRAAVRTAAPDLMPYRSHKIAVQVLKDLLAAGWVRGGSEMV
jgi:hypothetical protein